MNAVNFPQHCDRPVQTFKYGFLELLGIFVAKLFVRRKP